MSENKSSPQDPDGARSGGPVVTGEQPLPGATVPGNGKTAGNGTADAGPAGRPKAAEGAGAVAENAAAPAADGTAAADDGAGDTGGGAAALAGRPSKDARPGDGTATPKPSPTSKPAAASSGAAADAGRADDPPRPVEVPPAGEVPAPRPSAAGAAATSAAAGVPAAGPVPSPGPGAAAPPPWRRVPGEEAAAPAPEPTAVPVAGGLLDAPTTYIERPAGEEPSPGAGPAPSGGQLGGSAATESNWSAVRAVRNRPPRQAALQLKRLDPWSVLKLALVLAVVLFFIWLVGVGVLYGVLDGMGVWDRLNGTYNDLVSGETQTGGSLISAGRVFGLAAVVGAINSLLFAVAITVGAFVYNVSADLVGGIEVTLSERD
ncbi:DUF3566 domain-containing protein [Pseudonocardia sp. H11422]|uniref:DUF3566 domain-containing protein n=1 Tax=Pseudonocardia sp. H11422 TaxID=2835866 RepID=UPI003977AB0A